VLAGSVMRSASLSPETQKPRPQEKGTAASFDALVNYAAMRAAMSRILSLRQETG
jgi:hypothetical protein